MIGVHLFLKESIPLKTRLTIALVASLFVYSTATATLTLRKNQVPELGKQWNEELKLDSRKPEPKPEAKSEGGLQMTEKTEIKLDGQACRYEDVPRDAQIIHLEVGADRKTVLKVHFQRKK